MLELYLTKKFDGFASILEECVSRYPISPAFKAVCVPHDASGYVTPLVTKSFTITLSTGIMPFDKLGAFTVVHSILFIVAPPCCTTTSAFNAKSVFSPAGKVKSKVQVKPSEDVKACVPWLP